MNERVPHDIHSEQEEMSDLLITNMMQIELARREGADLMSWISINRAAFRDAVEANPSIITQYRSGDSEGAIKRVIEVLYPKKAA